MREHHQSLPAGIAADSRSDTKRPRADAARLEFLLYGLQSPVNIGMILRVAETYRFRVSIYDPHRVLDDAAKFATIKDFSCGAALRWGFRTVCNESELERLLTRHRLVSTSIEPRACPLPSYQFRAGDLFALGNEYDGLPDVLVERADTVLNIPMPSGWAPKPRSSNPIDPNRAAPVARDGQPSLNVAMTAGILCYASMVAGFAPLEEEDASVEAPA